jgi:ABC-type transporter Mla MlaB component
LLLKNSRLELLLIWPVIDKYVNWLLKHVICWNCSDVKRLNSTFVGLCYAREDIIITFVCVVTVCVPSKSVMSIYCL